MDRRILYILPSYGHFDYVWACVDSYFRSAAAGDACLLVDDASPDWDDEDVSRRTRDNPRLLALRFDRNGGLTRSWNVGLESARDLDFAYAVCGNSDVLFSKGWDSALLYALEQGYSLAGPLSNAPGITAGLRQQVDHYHHLYQLSDAQDDIDTVGQWLAAEHLHTIVAGPINGFLMAAKTSQWWEGKWDDRHVFRPTNAKAPSGRPNPTPLMTCNEDELQGRWSKLGLRSCVAVGSFVFHYRAVTRGDRHKTGKWMRRSTEGA